MIRLPQSTPDWLHDAIRNIEQSVESDIIKGRTQDEIIKASGAFSLWKKLTDEIDSAVEAEDAAVRAQTRKLHERTRKDDADA